MYKMVPNCFFITPAQFFKKLTWEINKLKEEKDLDGIIFISMNAAITVDSFIDWIYRHGDIDLVKEQRKKLKKKHSSLEICEEIANTAKHKERNILNENIEIYVAVEYASCNMSCDSSLSWFKGEISYKGKISNMVDILKEAHDILYYIAKGENIDLENYVYIYNDTNGRHISLATNEGYSPPKKFIGL